MVGAKTPSGSAVSRAFWISTPRIFLTVFALEAVGFWAAVLIVMVEVALQIPLYLVRIVRLPDGEVEI